MGLSILLVDIGLSRKYRYLCMCSLICAYITTFQGILADADTSIWAVSEAFSNTAGIGIRTTIFTGS